MSVIEQLRENAQQLLRLTERRPAEPVADLTVMEACDRLLLVYANFDVELTVGHCPRLGYLVKWKVWNGSRWFEHPLLRGAVEAAEAAAAGLQDEVPENVQQSLREMPAVAAG